MAYTMTLKVQREGSGWRALALIPMRDGRTLRIVSRATLAEARERLSGYRDEVGLSLATLIRQARNTAKKLAKSKAIKFLGKLAKNPIVQSLLPPQVTMALRGIQTAARAISAARRGSREALRAIQRATRNPAGAAALRMARAAIGPASSNACRCA